MSDGVAQVIAAIVGGITAVAVALIANWGADRRLRRELESRDRDDE